ncbi:MAG TPA: hypothetical protein VM582_00705, partial [Candidatus Thermoplasmatota archaeon]|nr:hypothetical protein [Candidatus Thermoplasmatota archaeon]
DCARGYLLRMFMLAACIVVLFVPTALATPVIDNSCDGRNTESYCMGVYYDSYGMVRCVGTYYYGTGTCTGVPL